MCLIAPYLKISITYCNKITVKPKARSPSRVAQLVGAWSSTPEGLRNQFPVRAHT